MLCRERWRCAISHFASHCSPPDALFFRYGRLLLLREYRIQHVHTNRSYAFFFFFSLRAALDSNIAFCAKYTGTVLLYCRHRLLAIRHDIRARYIIIIVLRYVMRDMLTLRYAGSLGEREYCHINIIQAALIERVSVCYDKRALMAAICRYAADGQERYFVIPTSLTFATTTRSIYQSFADTFITATTMSVAMLDFSMLLFSPLPMSLAAITPFFFFFAVITLSFFAMPLLPR